MENGGAVRQVHIWKGWLDLFGESVGFRFGFVCDLRLDFYKCITKFINYASILKLL